MSGEHGCDVGYRCIILAGDDEFDVSLSIIVDEPVPDVWYVRQVAADRMFEVLLRARPLRFGHVINSDGRLADLDGAAWHSPTVNKDARHLRPATQAFGDCVGHCFRVGEL